MRSTYESMVDESLLGLDQTTGDDFDKELNELIIRNQSKLAELHNDVKEVSKIMGEPVVNVRKLKPGRPGPKTLSKNSNKRKNDG